MFNMFGILYILGKEEVCLGFDVLCVSRQNVGDSV